MTLRTIWSTGSVLLHLWGFESNEAAAEKRSLRSRPPSEPHPDATEGTYIIPGTIMGDPSSYDLLMWAFNEVVEIIECLAEEIPGQAKGDLSHVIQVMESWPLEWTVGALPHLREGLQILHAKGCRQAAPSLARARKCMWKELAGE